MSDVRVRFWGVRGSIPSPGEHTVLVGGNTTCVEVEAGEDRIVFDAGSGLRGLGDAIMKRGGHGNVHLAFTHVHWDHIMGLPFFVPLYVPSAVVTLYSAQGTDLPSVLRRQMGSPVFPVALDTVGADVRYVELSASARTQIGGLTLSSCLLNHPDPVMAYRVDVAGRSVVFATDTEHGTAADDDLVKLARGADVLIYDAQYTPEEYETKRGWGHSTFEAGARIARAAGAKRLVLFHHDPSRTDVEVAAIVKRAKECFPETIAAREGLSIDLARYTSAATAALV